MAAQPRAERYRTLPRRIRPFLGGVARSAAKLSGSHPRRIRPVLGASLVASRVVPGAAKLSACVRWSSWRSLRLRSRIRCRSRTRQLLQRSTLSDGRVGVGTLGKTCAAAGGRDGQADGLAERGVRRGMLCLLVLRAASPRMVPPTLARGTCAHVGACVNMKMNVCRDCRL